MRRSRGSILVTLIGLLLPITAELSAAVLLTQEEALALAFPEATVERRNAFLLPTELEVANEAAGEEIESSLVSYYVGIKDGAEVGRAYFAFASKSWMIMSMVTSTTTFRSLS